MVLVAGWVTWICRCIIKHYLEWGDGISTKEMTSSGGQVLLHLELTGTCEAASPLASSGHLAAFPSPHGFPAILRVDWVVLDSRQQYSDLNHSPLC